MNDSSIRERATKAIANKVFPGCVVGIINKTGERNILPFGNFTYEAGAHPVLENTVYDTASITKTIPVALTAPTLIEQGKLSLEDKIIKYLPEITIPDADKGLIKHLLTYTYVLKKNSDLNFSYEHSKAKDIFEFLFKREFEFLPGTHYQYANAALNLLGIILERISGEKLYALTKRIILDPLEMKNSIFYPHNKDLIPPTEIVSWRGEIQGEVHDETASILQKEDFNPGCAGLFSNVDDLLNVAEMMLHDGVYKGNRLFTPETMALMTTNALSDIGEWSGIGWELNQPIFMGKHAHEHMVGKTGFTGTLIVVDPMRGVGLVLLSNRTYPKRSETATIRTTRQDMANIVFGNL